LRHRRRHPLHALSRSAFAIASLLTVKSAGAEDAAPPAPPAPPPIAALAPRHPELRYDLGLGVTVSTAFLVTELVTESHKSDFAPPACRWCDREGDVDKLNGLDAGVRKAFVWSEGSRDTANTLSAITVISAGLSGPILNAIAARTEGAGWETVGVDTLVVTETVAAGMATNQLVKFTVARERPYAHFRTPPERARLANVDDNLSFYSGHTKLAFSAATSAGMVATMRRYKLAPVVWAVGMGLATLTGYLRIAADRHYFTDVATGATLGIAYGLAIPYVFHRPRVRGASDSTIQARLAISPTPSGTVLGVTGTF
jgi:membrane-associated phospholipid phosphatase